MAPAVREDRRVLCCAGVVGQYAFEAPWEGGYRVIPRFKSDVSDAPLVLPVTGDE